MASSSSTTTLPYFPSPSLHIAKPPPKRKKSFFHRNPVDPVISPTRSTTMFKPAQKPKKWRLIKGYSQNDVSKEQGSTGTIIHAVPMNNDPPSLIRTPRLSSDRSVTHSPGTDPGSSLGTPSPPPSLRSFYSSIHSNSSNGSLPRSARSGNSLRRMGNKKQADEIIGVYKDGKVRWTTPEPAVTVIQHPMDAFRRRGSKSTCHTIPELCVSSSRRDSRPRIQVIIPNDQRRQQFSSRPFIDSGRLVSPPLDDHLFEFPRPVPSVSPAGKDLQIQERSESSETDSESGSLYSANSSRTSFATDDQVKQPLSTLSEIPISLHSRRTSVAFSTSSGEDDAMGVQAPEPLSLCASPVELQSRRRSSISTPLRNHFAGDHRRSSSSNSSSSTKRRISSARSIEAVQQASSEAKSRGPSPTLSEAEHDLQKHLTCITEDLPFQLEELLLVGLPRNTTGDAGDEDEFGHGRHQNFDVVEVDVPLKVAASEIPPPSLPKRSSKRLTAASSLQLPQNPLDLPAQPCSRRATICSPQSPPTTLLEPPSDRSRSYSRGRGLRLEIPSYDVSTWHTIIEQPLPPTPHDDDLEEMERVQRDHDISAEQAEAVILRILENLGSIEDLFACSAVNQGFYRTFKHHDLHLIRTVLKNNSAPAWEHQEMCPPIPVDTELDSAAPLPEVTLTAYVQSFRADSRVLSSIKALILERCDFLRPETVNALRSSSDRATRVDDALWRLWTFCKVFGSGKGREEDVVAQMDWLRGGPIFHQKACRSTVVTSTTFDFGSVLASAPEAFAQGNPGGLTSDQVYDMTELWNALTRLLQGILARPQEARAHGVYDNTAVCENDLKSEEHMLEEWHYYLLTLGLSTIVDLATAPEVQMFDLASTKGWTTWTPPANGGSRGTFIKEALARMFAETNPVPSPDPSIIEAEKEAHRARIEPLQEEIYLRKERGDGRKVTMSMERPMSEWESMAEHFQVDSPTLGTGLPPMPMIPEIWRKDTRQQQQSARSSSSSDVPVLQLSSSLHPALRNISASSPPTPPLPPRPVAFSRQHFDHNATPTPVSIVTSNDPAAHTADKAIFRIVEMGFTAEQARHALRVTDMGDGLRIDRAVELLLRGGQ